MNNKDNNTSHAEALAHAEDRGHHPDSPSSLQASAACAHFKNRGGTSPAAIAGTRQHAAVESRDLSALVDEAEVDAVTRCIALEDELIAQMGNAGAEDVLVEHEIYLAVDPDEVVTDAEGRVWRGITGGSPDTRATGRWPGGGQLALILDWKCGKNLVTPTAKNLQGMAYALATLQEQPNVQEVMVVFYHPHIERDQRLPEYTATFSRDDMARMLTTIRAVVKRKHLAQERGWIEVPPEPHYDLCQWCARIGECPAMYRLAVETRAKYARVEVPAEVHPAYLSEPAGMSAVYRLSKLVETWAKAARKRVLDAVLTEDVSLPDMRVVTKSDRSVLDMGAVARVAAEFGVTEEELQGCINLPITKLEEVIKTKAAPRQGAARVREFQSLAEAAGAVGKGSPYCYLTEVKQAPSDD
jgi:putative NIF3 family GTP cyclohydrolase 1 type 2